VTHACPTRPRNAPRSLPLSATRKPAGSLRPSLGRVRRRCRSRQPSLRLCDRGWFMFATPLLSNGGTSRGLPISCYLNYMADSRRGINDHYEETSYLSSLGGGVGGYIAVRSNNEGTSKGSASSGATPFICVIDRYMLAFSQGKTRRGSYAAYLDISHPEIREFLNLRKASGGDANRKALNLHHAVVIPDSFMKAARTASIGRWSARRPARSSRSSMPAICSARSSRPATRPASRSSCSATPPTGRCPSRSRSSASRSTRPTSAPRSCCRRTMTARPSAASRR
jgi:hypothetical protein